MSAVVNSTDFRNDYNTVLEKLAADAFKAALNHFENVVDENGGKLSFNFEDICNMVTHAAQAARRDFVTLSNQS